MATSRALGLGGIFLARKITIAFTCGLIALVFLSPPALCADDRPAGEAEKIVLPRTYEPGHYELVEESLYQRLSGIKSIMTYGMSTEAAEDGNGLVATIGITRIINETKDRSTGKLRMLYDSDKALGHNTQDRRKCRVKALLSPEGKIIKKSGGNGTELDKKIEEKIETTLLFIAGEPYAYCPEGPVAVGAKWTIRRKVIDLQALTNTDTTEEANCELVRVETDGKHRVAVIKVEAIRHGESKPYKSRTEIKGNVRIYLGGDTLCEQDLSIDSTIYKVDDSGQVANAGKDRISVSVKQRITLTRKNASILKPIESIGGGEAVPAASKPAAP